MQLNQGRSRTKRLSLAGVVLVAAATLLAAACGGGTSSADKTSTAAAAKPAATSAVTKAAATSAATAAATKAATTPAAGATTAATAASGAGVKVADSTVGKILVDARGFTLYTFKNDVAGSGKSAAEALTAVWPPLSLDAAPSGVTGATGAWAMFTRADGKTQVTYKGMPLYFFVNDKAAGDTNGDKVGNVWFAATP
jgi:predicted lipoprotein with Yx(FWY)xxD motif